MPNGTDQTDTSATDTSAATDTAAAAGAGPDDATEAAKWKALARKHEEQAKANADKAKRFDALEEANKTEQQKLIERAEKAEKALAARDEADKARALREEIAKDRGITAGVLRGSTREEIEAHADELSAAFKVEKPKAPPADGQGNAGGTVHEQGEMSADDIVKQALAR